MRIHPTAIIHSEARVAETVEIGPYVTIGADVEIGEGSRIFAHSSLTGPHIVIGKNNQLGPHASFLSHVKVGDNNSFLQFVAIGAPPQDIKFLNEDTWVEIGDNNIFREYVSVNRGTPGGKGLTRIQNNSFIMGYTHIAHDCRIGNHVVLASYVGLAGHVDIDDYAVVGGMTGVNQYSRIGTFAYLGGCSGIPRDVPPFMLVQANTTEPGLRGINSIGLRRQGVSSETIRELKTVFKILFLGDLTIKEGIHRIRKERFNSPETKKLLEFIETSKQGIMGRKKESSVTEIKDSRHRRGLSGELPLR